MKPKNSDLLRHRKDVLARIQGGRFWAVSNPDGPVAELRIYDEIWYFGVNADDFSKELDQITAPEILVAINSPGGDVFDAIAIYNALRNHPAKITTRVDGIAASAASVIVQAGDNRVMMSAAQLMIHEPWGLAVGSASEMRAFADLLDRQTEVLASIYAERSGKSLEHFLDLLRSGDDIWLSDDESIEQGLADEISSPTPKAKAMGDPKLIDQVRTAVDAVAAAIESAGRVAALRAEKGKGLSKVNTETLALLHDQMQQLEAVLTPELEPAVALDRDPKSLSLAAMLVDLKAQAS